MSEFVKTSEYEGCTVLTLDRPERLNALNNQTLDELSEAFSRLQESEARAVIITGAGEKSFCAGADIGEILSLDTGTKKRKSERGQSIFAMLDNLPMPSVALINGFAFGGGLELAMACTFRLATPNARMGLPEIKIGLVPGYGGTQRLPRIVGEARALDMILTGRAVLAEEAHAIGLVHRIISEPSMDLAMNFVNSFADYSRSTMSFSKQSIVAARTLDLGDGLAVEAELSTQAYLHSDAQEGIAAFVEKRRPVFNQ